MSKRIFLQRQTRVLNDLFSIFFSAECQKFYKPLLKLKVVQESRMISVDEQKISIALGQVVQLCIHFATALCITVKNTMIFNGSKSYIHSEDTVNNRNPPYKLFIKDKSDRDQIKISLALLEENLLKVYQALKFLKDRENIGYVSVSNDEVEYPNRIIRFLHKIADFQQ